MAEAIYHYPNRLKVYFSIYLYFIPVANVFGLEAISKIRDSYMEVGIFYS